MATGLNRISISVTPALQEKFDEAQKDQDYKKTKNEMFRELIALGLHEAEEKKIKFNINTGG